MPDSTPTLNPPCPAQFQSCLLEMLCCGYQPQRTGKASPGTPGPHADVTAAGLRNKVMPAHPVWPLLQHSFTNTGTTEGRGAVLQGDPAAQNSTALPSRVRRAPGIGWSTSLYFTPLLQLTSADQEDKTLQLLFLHATNHKLGFVQAGFIWHLQSFT